MPTVSGFAESGKTSVQRIQLKQKSFNLTT